MTICLRALVITILVVAQLLGQAAAPARPRARDTGLSIGVLPAGPLNAITDVSGVLIGHTTIVRGDNVLTLSGPDGAPVARLRELRYHR